MLQEIDERPDRQSFKDHFTAHFFPEDAVVMLDEMDKPDRYEVCIAVWPDGTWCYRGDISEFLHKSDDYKFIHPSIIDEDELEQIVLDSIAEDYC